MKQLTVISGKGGTGKTSIVSAFASLAEDALFADCDVDAPDLHVIMQPKILERQDFYGHKIASIDIERCIKCEKCKEYCRFGAFTDNIEIIREKCEGCGVCEYICPTNAITMKDKRTGFTFISETRFGLLSHAQLNVAEETSGLLVSLVRNNAKILAKKHNKKLIIIDGPPGIGCPVIASITGVDLVLIVTEPTVSGIHDLERILKVADHFKIPSLVCINKYNINEENCGKIKEYCNNKGIDVVGKIPYDEIVTKAMIEGKNIIEYTSNHNVSKKIVEMWNRIEEKLKVD
jgi:MinD superfamily P-loop ATPase